MFFLENWNYELLVQDEDEGINTDGAIIGPSLAVAAANIAISASPTDFQGLNFCGSYGLTERGRMRNQWATSLVGTRLGVSVHMDPRKRKKANPKCPQCNPITKTCTKCSADTRGAEEKRGDVRMASDMVKLAWVDNYDVAVLVSSDADFVPVAEFHETRGIKVIHGAFPPKGHPLSSCCWGRINLPKLCEEFRFR